MGQDLRVKICGLRDAASIAAAVDAGVHYIGFNFYPKSPRFVTFAEAADLAAAIPVGVAKVGLVVDMDDATLDALCGQVPLDFIQLHGHETPERVGEVKARTGLPVIKVVGVAAAADLAELAAQAQVADQILIDAKPPKDAVLPGGNGITFDWKLIAGLRLPVPWMLAGGLTAANVAEAVSMTGAKEIDLASGVESAPGVKDSAMIQAFMDAVSRI